MADLTPETREEIYLASISGQAVELPYPLTREEQYLAYIAGEAVVIPSYPLARKELYLNEIAVNGASGSINALIDKSIESVNCKVTTVGEYAFYNCTALSDVKLTSATTIQQYAFNGCSAIVNLEIPAAVTINDFAFYGCSSVEYVKLKAIEKLSTACFRGCTSLQKVDIDSKVTIGSSVFLYDTKLDTLILRSNELCPLSSTTAFGSSSTTATRTPIYNGTGYVYVPKDLVDTYKSATNWITFADQIRAIEDYPDVTGG